MDYKKTNAPTTTVTRDMMELCSDTGNVYETVAIIGSVLIRLVWKSRTIFLRNWQSLLLILTTWKKCLKIESKSRFLVIMRSCRNRT